MYYYAMLNRQDIVTSVYALLSPLPESKYIVEISKAWYEDKRLIGMKYDRESHGFVFWACSSDNVQWHNTSESVTAKIDSMDSAISEAKVDISSLNSDMASAIKQIAETAATADNASAAVDRLDTDLAIMRNQVGGLEDSVGSVSHEVGQLEADFIETKAKTEEALRTANTDIMALSAKTTVNASEISSVNTRIDSIQRGFVEDLASVNEKTSDNQKSIANLVTASAQNAIGIQNLEAVNTQQNAEITRIDQNVEAVIHTANDHEGAINALDDRVSANAGDIVSLIGSVNNVEEDIVGLSFRQERNDNSINTIWDDIRIKEAETADFKAETAENFLDVQKDINAVNTRVNTVDSALTTFKRETAENFDSAQEAVNDLDARVTANAGEINTLKGSMSSAEANIRSLVTSVNGITADFENVEKAVDKAEADILAIKNVTTQQREKITALESSLPAVATQANTNKNDIASLKTSVSTANTNITNLTKRVTTAETDIKTLQSDVTTAKSNITSVTNKANTNASNITALTTRVTNAESKLNTATSNITSVTNKANTNASNITSLTTRVTAAENEIAAAEADVTDIKANKVLQLTAENGQPKYMFREGDNLLQGLLDLPLGATTAYANNGAIGVPKSNEQWRMMVHKTNAEILWVIAFGSVGSVYTNYYNTASYGWQGWKCEYNALPEALWKGGQYPNASANIAPTKNLSECRNGWILLWSDYDASTKTVNDFDFFTSVIYKCKPDGTKWNGESFNFSIPNYITTEEASDARIMKKLKIYDNKIVGYNENSVGNRNDVVLRAVMEF